MQDDILRDLDTSDDAWPPGRRYYAGNEHVNACISETHVLTSGPMGGDGGHGGFVRIDLTDQASSSWTLAVASLYPSVSREVPGPHGPIDEHCYHVNRLTFVARGDAECENLLAAFKMIVETLERAFYVATPGHGWEGEDKDLLPPDPRTIDELLDLDKVYTRSDRRGFFPTKD